MTIIERGAPGGVNIKIDRVRRSDGVTDWLADPVDEGSFEYDPSRGFDLEFDVVNSGGTGFLSPDNCNNGQGTLLTLVIDEPNVSGTTTVGPFCHDDEGFIGSPVEVEYTLTDISLGDNPSGDYVFWVEGSNTGDRMTPKYALTPSPESSDGSNGGDDGDDDSTNGGNGGNDDPTDGGSDESDGNFSLSDLEYSCSIEDSNIDVGETTNVDISADGFVPLDAPASLYKFDINLYLNGSLEATGEGSASANGASGDDFDVTPTSSGDITVSFDVGNLRQDT